MTAAATTSGTAPAALRIAVLSLALALPLPVTLVAAAIGMIVAPGAGVTIPRASRISSSLSSSHCSSVRWLSGIASSSWSRRRGETGCVGAFIRTLSHCLRALRRPTGRCPCSPAIH